VDSIFTRESITIFLAFFIPGFIATEAFGLFVGVRNDDLTKRLPAIVGYSAIHYGFWGFIPFFLVRHGVWHEVWLYLIVLVLPVLWAPIVLCLRDPARWRPVFSNPKKMFAAMLIPERAPWDRIFVDGSFHVRIRTKNGAWVGGYYGNGSIASSFPDEREIYVSEAYRFSHEGALLAPIPGTGVFVPGDQIEHVDIIRPTHERKEK
jgi:hypothetical protein